MATPAALLECYWLLIVYLGWRTLCALPKVILPARRIVASGKASRFLRYCCAIQKPVIIVGLSFAYLILWKSSSGISRIYLAIFWSSGPRIKYLIIKSLFNPNQFFLINQPLNLTFVEVEVMFSGMLSVPHLINQVQIALFGKTIAIGYVLIVEVEHLPYHVYTMN